MIRFFVSAAAFAMAPLAAAPALAQDDSEKVNQVIVYGDQPCPEAVGTEIVVCVRQEDPYRIPSPLRKSEAPQNEAWAQKVEANASVGATGVGSCSTVGQSGQTGCGINEIERAYAEKEQADGVRMGVLIAEERAKRLSEIDAAAAAEQARVEQIEREYNARINGEPAPAPVATDAEVVAGE